jgi:hypothetical protein
MNYFASVTLPGGLGLPRARPPGTATLSFELGSIPHLDRDQRRVGFNGFKDEDLNKADLFGRARVYVGLPWRTSLTLAIVPPVRVFGLKPSLLAVALERPLHESGPWSAGMRVFGQVGKVEGAITCPGKVARHPQGSPENPYGCDGKSADQASQRHAGAEVSTAWRLERFGGLSPYFTGAVHYLDTAVQVHASTFGFLDRSRLSAGTWTWSVGAGAEYPLSERVRIAAGDFYSPLDVIRLRGRHRENDGLLNFRVMVSYELN